MVAVVIGAMVAGTSEREPSAKRVGFHETLLTVAHRDVPLPVFIWYPTDDKATPELIAQNALFYGFHAVRDAAGSRVPASIVLLSHGSGGNASALGWLAADLAAAGNIVVATNHPGTTSRDSLPERTVMIWERAQDLSAMIDNVQASLPFGIVADTDRISAVGFSLGGYSMLSLAGARVSKDRFIDYCAAYPDQIDCGWMNAKGLDFQSIDQARYEQSNRDARVGRVVAIDPALPLAVVDGRMSDLSADVLVVQLGDGGMIPPGLLWDKVVAQSPRSELTVVPDTYHFAFLSECSRLGKWVIGLAGDDNICSDEGTRQRAEVHEELRGLINAFLDWPE